LQALPPDSVKVGTRVLTIKEWLDGIKKDWGFEESIPRIGCVVSSSTVA